ncbi:MULTISPECIES: type VII secretion system-associated protein [Streptomyces]|uniref:Type VII secretion system-associated protein n=1 Tax=Streptomyces heilongjiangensis TaxID=945052 RepID=A0ABW1BBS4_9ACTN|nr:MULTISPECIES: type VII secretion system-associated protein [Streptomyces]MDC2950521.1 type VII secretion system-associated protein [Streptomyces heilongjiangensis]
MADLTHLDAGQLTSFADHELTTFSGDLTKIRNDTADQPPVESLFTLHSVLSATPHRQLAIGPMGAAGTVHGDALRTNLVALARNIDRVFVKQKKLFQDMDRDLRDTVTTLLNTSGSSLQAVSADRFISSMADVGRDIGGTASTL